MYYEVLPEDLYYFYILKFLFGKCNKCNKFYHYTDLKHKCKILKYKSIFDDNYGFPEEIGKFPLICKFCIKRVYYMNPIINYN